MTSVQKALIIVLILSLSNYSFGVILYRQKRAQNQYILHRCIASVDLIKTQEVNRRPAELISSDVRKEDIDDSNLHYDTTMTQRNNKRIRMHGNSQDLDLFADSKDTPLRTVNIQGLHKDRPLIFKKKYPLPELQRNVRNRISEMSTNVIVIKSLP